MPKKSITGFRPGDIVSSSAGRTFYHDDDIAIISAAAGGLSSDRGGELAQCLERCADMWALQSCLQKAATYKQRAEALGDIERAAKNLLLALMVDDDGSIERMPFELRQSGLQRHAAREAPGAPGAPDPRARVLEQIDGDPERAGEALLYESVLGVARLHRWAKADREWVEGLAELTRSGNRQSAGHMGDPALNTLIAGLAVVGREFFGLRPLGRADGPMVRFIQACLEPLDIEPPTGEGIRDRIRVVFKGKGRRPSPDKTVGESHPKNF